MKEIIYIQAGSLANHVGTHFWNTQQCYFSFEEGDEILVEHDISFREGISLGVSMKIVSYAQAMPTIQAFREKPPTVLGF